MIASLPPLSEPVSIFWFRRDLRVYDNHGLFEALSAPLPVLPVFIFDRNILDDLKDRQDRRVSFIHVMLRKIKNLLNQNGSDLWVGYGYPDTIFEELLSRLPVRAVYTNRDYEPYAVRRDESVAAICKKRGIPFFSFKDQVIFEPEEIVSNAGTPYTVYTPYMKKWRQQLSVDHLNSFPSEKLLHHLVKLPPVPMISLQEMGFEESLMEVPSPEVSESIIRNYHRTRDFPALNGTSRLSVHLRFGTISVRELVRKALQWNDTYVNELIWREFFMAGIRHFPAMVDQPFRENFRNFPWRWEQEQFQRWCGGETGFPLIDAGMRELNATGYMHNRVRMVVANFLTKLLRMDWRTGERYFAEKLLDFELSSNVGNWQWSAGCGMDAAPYFRIFNPETQMDKFDPNRDYIRKWVPELNTSRYPNPMISYKKARQEYLELAKKVL